VDELKQFRLGRLSEESGRQLGQHFSQCPACLENLSRVPPEDALIEGLRGQRNRPRLNNPLLAGVRQDVLSRPFRPPAHDQATPVGIAGSATLAGEESQTSEVTVAAPSWAFEAIKDTHAFLSPPRGPEELGWVDSYRILRVLGEGGMGLVLLAEDTRLQRRVALKAMKPMLAADSSARSRFLREARATAALDHDHIISIHHIGEAKGVPYLVMPMLQGETLDDRLKREGLLTVKEVLRIGRETALGLAAAHEKQLIHRDIKPANLWLEAPSGRVKVLDFGLAAMACPEGEKTLPGTLLGTPGYMAPEQTEGVADHRSDLFSLGCVLYRMATGKLPFEGKTVLEKIRSTLFEKVVPPQEINPALPAPLCNLIVRLLSPKATDRPATALAVARVLETLQVQLAGGVMVTPPQAIPVAGLVTRPDAATPAAGMAAPAAVTEPASGRLFNRRRFALLLNRRRFAVVGGAATCLLVLIVALVAWPGAGSKPDPDDNPRSGPPEGEEFGTRPNARRPVRVRTDQGPAPKPNIDSSFAETWVTRPAPIDGLKSWCIETNDVGRFFPIGFDFTLDEGLLITYNTGPRQMFDPKTCGLRAAPFGGTYSAMTLGGKTCARVVTGGVQLWDREGAPRERITLRSPGPRHAAEFSPDGKTIVTPNCDPSGNYSNELWFWDVVSGGKLGVFQAANLTLYATYRAWSPDSKTLAVSSGSGVALFRSPWNTMLKNIARRQPVHALSWSPDGKLLAIVEADQKIHVIDVETEASVLNIKDVKVPSSTFIPAWSVDGTELAFGSEDRKVLIWNLKEKKFTYTFPGHTRPLTAVAYLGDGKTLISGSRGSTRFWDLEKNSLRGSLLNLSGSGSLAIVPDGYYRCEDDVKNRFVFRVREEGNRLREFSPDEFRTVFGWKNHPEKVKLTGD
jgi:hypothetical protein